MIPGCIRLLLYNHSASNNLIPGEYSNGTAQSTKIEEDDYDPYGDEPDAEEEKPSTAAVKTETENGGDAGPSGEDEEEMQEDEEEGEDEDEDDEDDGLDIVVTAPQRSMDFR
jgi:hypothetical protein